MTMAYIVIGISLEERDLSHASAEPTKNIGRKCR